AYPQGANYYLEIEPKPGPEPDPTRDPGHTDVFHISGSVQRSVSSAAEMAALGLLAVEPSPDKHLWAHFWRDAGRVYDEHDALSMKTRAYGVIIGRDLSKNDKKTLGLAAHIGKADVSGKGRWDGATSDTDFWGVLLYGRRETDKWLFTGDVGFSWFKTDYTEAGGATADNARATGLSAGGRVWYKWIEDPRPGRLNVRPFIGLRWNRFRQKGYDYDNGTASAAYTVDQFLVPLGVKFEWGESVNKKNWRTKPSLELSYIRTFGDRDADTSIYERGRRFLPAKTPLSGRDTFSAQFRYNSRREDFQWELNAGVRHNSSETDLNVGATLRWDL
ncbi:MAG: autotransporter outer membrane beta-barrel domain-containing protein, partial [Pyramidobacter sp.]|nr:autotransporter outer membrane beta-barrel domain-containing protein [Pyramidobacter sp.]